MPDRVNESSLRGQLKVGSEVIGEEVGDLRTRPSGRNTRKRDFRCSDIFWLECFSLSGNWEVDKELVRLIGEGKKEKCRFRDDGEQA
jgi:hypothetical protein